MLSIYHDGLHRKEPLEIPEDALREIIFNSIKYVNENRTRYPENYPENYPEDFGVDSA